MAKPSRDSASNSGSGNRERKPVEGGFPYTPSIGPLRAALSKIPEVERPTQFTHDFLNNVMQVSGGSSRPIPSILRTVGFISSDGRPTDLYDEFRSEQARGNAALKALRNGFPEVFRRSQYAHKIDDQKLRDIVVSVTGRPKSDRVIGYITNTFDAFKSYVGETDGTALVLSSVKASEEDVSKEIPSKSALKDDVVSERKLTGLSYHINIVLPETTNVEVFDTIFKSLKENLLR